MSKILPWLFFAAFFAVVAWGLSSMLDPQNAAKAMRTQMQAQSEAAASAQQLQQQALDYARQNTEAERLAQQWLMWKATLGWISVISISAVAVAQAVGAAFVSLKLWRILAMFLEYRASFVPLDPKTGQFPLLQYAGKGFVTLTNPNTGQTLLLDSSNSADRDQIRAAGNVQLAGVLSRNAASHKDKPEGISVLGWPTREKRTRLVSVVSAPTDDEADYEDEDYDDV